MERLQKSILLLFTLSNPGLAEEEKPCEASKESIEKMRDYCRKKLKVYASEKYDLGIFGIKKMRDSNKEQDIPVKKELSAFAKKCRDGEASKLKEANIITHACFEKITSQNTPFD
jgi:hypothetical protein